VPRYHYDVSISRQKRFIRRFKQFLLVLLVIAATIGLIILADAVRQNLRNDPQTGTPKVTVIRPSIREFDTEYFTFSTPTNWTNVAESTSGRTFVYRSYRGQLVEQELTVYVNGAPEDLSATHVLPVRVDEQNRLVPTEVSGHCNTVSDVKKANAPLRVTIMQTSMLCRLDDTNFLVAVGEKGGSTNIKMRRADGSGITYSFLYRSSAVPPDTLELVNIINSFMPV
jgi:hypothetical protein